MKYWTIKLYCCIHSNQLSVNNWMIWPLNPGWKFVKTKVRVKKWLLWWYTYKWGHNYIDPPLQSKITAYWKVPALVLYLPKSCMNNNKHTVNPYLHSSRERNEAQRRTKVSFDRIMMKALELLQLEKINVSGGSDIE